MDRPRTTSSHELMLAFGVGENYDQSGN